MSKRANKGRIRRKITVEYQWDCPHCKDAGVRTADRKVAEYCKKIHNCKGKTEEDRK